MPANSDVEPPVKKLKTLQIAAPSIPENHAFDLVNKNILPLGSALELYYPLPTDSQSNECNFGILQLISMSPNLMMISSLLLHRYAETTANMTKTSVMAKKTLPNKNQMSTFSGCKFGNIGTLNIHIHKH